MYVDKITLAHGAGGYETSLLIHELFVKVFKLKNIGDGIGLNELDDSATIPIGNGKSLAITVDSYTVKPVFFPGGDIGKLAASGTINDLAVIGAEPIAFMDSIVVEEGFPLKDLKKIINSYKSILDEYHIALLGGDFKVMPKDSLDQVIFTSIGIGLVDGKPLVDSNVEPGDVIVVTGPIGSHGAAILASQLGLEDVEVRSDCRPILPAIRIAKKLNAIKAAKDPTRGGIAMALNEFAQKSHVDIIVYEEKIPVKEEVKALAEMTGVDVYALASEGQALIVTSSDRANELVEALRRNGFREAEIIGEARRPIGHKPRVYLKTLIGGTRVLEVPRGELVPRIC